MVLELGEPLPWRVGAISADSGTIAIEFYGKGRLNSRALVESNDEFGRLAKVYNSMAEGIKQLLKDLKEYNETLEQTVEDRTKELKTAIDLQIFLNCPSFYNFALCSFLTASFISRLRILPEGDLGIMSTNLTPPLNFLMGDTWPVK